MIFVLCMYNDLNMDPYVLTLPTYHSFMVSPFRWTVFRRSHIYLSLH